VEDQRACPGLGDTMESCGSRACAKSTDRREAALLAQAHFVVSAAPKAELPLCCIASAGAQTLLAVFSSTS